MGIFDKFKQSKSKALGEGADVGSDSSLPVKSSERATARVQQALDQGRTLDLEQMAEKGRKIIAAEEALCRQHFIIALDATASMEELIRNAKENIRRIMERLASEGCQGTRFQIVIYRDYGCREPLEVSDVTDDHQNLHRFLADVHTDSDGNRDWNEAVELALAYAQKREQLSGVLLMGDAAGHTPGEINAYGVTGKTALEVVKDLAGMNRPVYTFLVGSDSETAAQFEQIAQVSGGAAGRLDGSEAMFQMAVMAVLSKVKGAEGVENYLQKYQTALPETARQFAKQLTSGTSKRSTS